MDASAPSPSPESIDVDRLLLIVTGAHLRSEVGDRPLAYGLKTQIDAWCAQRAFEESGPHDDPRGPFDAIVCSDVWALNNDELRACPTISIGGPNVNALGAYLADRLDSAFVIENAVMVQLDLDQADLVASCWGADHRSTVAAVEAFRERYLEDFLEASADRMATR